MLKYERITADNLEYAVSVQEELFPSESGRANFEDAVSGKTDFEYWLLYEENECAGVIGIYQYAIDPQSAWLGWFGILEKFRRRHLGSEALKYFEETARARHFRFARLYTDAVDNDEAIAFYRANGYTSEPYLNKEDPACIEWPMLIFSKTLCDESVPSWNSRNIGLSEQIAKQNKSGKESS